MTADLKVVPLRPTPSLGDIPGQLRQLADALERGETLDGFALDAVEAVYVTVVHADQFRPTWFGWGSVGNRYELAGLFTLIAKMALDDGTD